MINNQLELFPEFEMVICSTHGYVRGPYNKCSYCEAGWKCIEHGPFNSSTYQSVFIAGFYKNLTWARQELNESNGCPCCFERDYFKIPLPTIEDPFYYNYFAAAKKGL
tara:strand:- start:229 stop:552 length:324 start_codon:yes stop_codon:yes gene_type:complete